MQLVKNLDALLITNPVNIQYLTGFVSVEPGARESYVLVTQKTTYFFTNSLYREQAKQLSNVELVEISRDSPLSKKLSHLCKKEKIQMLGFEETDLTVAEYNQLAREVHDVKLIPTQGQVEMLRMIKRESEIEQIREAAKLTDQCFRHILLKLTPGVSEKEIAWQIESFIRKTGGSLAFSPIVAFGSHTSQPHYQQSHVSSVRCQDKDIILLDFGARINGYCSDMTRVVFVGKPKDEWRRAYDVVLEAQKNALHSLKANVSGAHLDRRAKAVIKKAGFSPYSHSLGHAVGLAIHESPRLTVKKDVRLKPGMVVTIEPAIYKEGHYGIRIEDLVLLKEDDIEILSKSQKEMVIL